ncbi:MAG TPA: YdeI/OmpD-associated family protein [Chitinispirillaceae bacterium]|nr:YdeI/OmpD-associated family protein [Chitinispirillaceae bacterium]
MSDDLYFTDRKEFRKWLSTMDFNSKGVWIVFHKNGEFHFTASDALEEALSFGWIDGLIKKIDDNQYKKYFSPRKKGSRWSDKNKVIVDKLIKSGMMTKNGLLVIQRAKEDGSWEIADQKYIQDDKYVEFEKRICGNTKAYAHYQEMSQSIKKQFVGLYNEPKREDTRERKLKELIELLENNIRPMDKYKK